ncbi:MAG: hypothetical protein ACYDA1_09970 [Vulcanimicrobiaceae bacterium]
MAMQQPTDTPFGLQANVAAGLAYLLGILGGIIMLVGGGTNGFVKWAAAQSITFWGLYIVVAFALPFIGSLTHLWALIFPLSMIWRLLALVVWLATFITAFQGKELRLPVIADLTTRLFPGVA